MKQKEDLIGESCQSGPYQARENGTSFTKSRAGGAGRRRGYQDSLVVESSARKNNIGTLDFSQKWKGTPLEVPEQESLQRKTEINPTTPNSNIERREASSSFR